MNKNTQHVFLVGAKSLGSYGGFETFVDKLTEYHQNNNRLKYHVACKLNGAGYMDEEMLSGVIEQIKAKDGSVTEFTYHNARCFKIKVPNVGAVQAIYYDVAALNKCCRYIKKNRISNPIIYIMACRIGPFVAYFYKKVQEMGGCERNGVLRFKSIGNRPSKRWLNTVILLYAILLIPKSIFISAMTAKD